MWILVIGQPKGLALPDSGAAVLRDLGCEVVTADVWDDLHALMRKTPPVVVFLEAIDEVGAARAALLRCAEVPALAGVPALLGVSVKGLSQVKAEDAFHDVVLHPYVPPELYLRVRRAEWRSSDFARAERIKIGALDIDLAAHEVRASGRVVELTQQEFALLSFLCQRRGRVFSRQQLLSQVWGVEYYGGSRTVDIHVRRLRQKLGAAVDDLETVRGVGYKMKAPA